jgi:CHASE3 domain sensor protein
MNTWTIRRRILVSFAVVLSPMIIMGGIAYLLLERIDDDGTDIQKNSLPALWPLMRAA